MMDLEETEDEDRDTIITSTSQQHWSEPYANSGNKVNCMLERGLNVGRKMLVFGFVASSVPLVAPGFLVASAIGLVVSVPCCFFLVSHRCTQNVMSKLLPMPMPRLTPQDVCFKQDIDVTSIDKDSEAKSDSELVDVNEETMILDNDCEQGVVKEEFEPELSHHSGDANNVIHDDEKMEGYLSGESSEERLMSRGTVMEGFDESEKLKVPFEFGDAAVALEECGDEVKEDGIGEEEMQKETKGLLEKIRDEGRNDMRGLSSGLSENDQDIGRVVENMEEKQDLGTDGEMWNQEDSKVNEETMQSKNDDSTDSVCNEVESCEPTTGILELEDDGLNDSKKLVDETSELLDGRSLQDEAIGDSLKEMHVLHVLVAEDSSKVEELEPAVSNLVNQETKLREYNKRMHSSDADASEITDEIEFHLCDENRIDVEAHSCTIDLHEEPSNVKKEFEPELSHRSSDVDNVVQHNGSEEDNNDYFAEEEEEVEEEPSSQNHDDEKMEGQLSGETSEERLMSGGTIMEDFDETEELKAPFEFGDTTVVLEECEDEVKDGDIEEEEMQKETKGLLEKIRDEGRNDMRGENATRISSETSENDQDIGQVAENMEVGREMKQDLGTDGDMRNQEDSKVYDETVHDVNTVGVCNEVESCEPTSDILELEDDGSKPMDETPELLDGRGLQDEPIGDSLIETQVLHVLVGEDSSEVKELEPAISKKGELDENISNLVNQETELHEYNKRTNSSDADTDAREIDDEIEYHSCDENRIDAEAHSYTIDLHEEPSNVTVDMHTDSMEVLVSSEELESTSSKCSSDKNIVCPSDEVLFNEENIWKQIHAVRKIIGYEGTTEASCADALKALYIFTGVEPPSFGKEKFPFDPAEIDEKLHFLMSIVGIKMTDLP